MGLVKWTFILALLLQLMCIAEGCIELDAESSINNFTSHDNYTAQYPNDYSECWIITASSGNKVRAWSDDNIELEGCDDFLDVFCGDSSSDELYETYCDEAIVDVVSYGNQLRFEFTTDSSDATSGFRIEYEEVSASTSSSCSGSSSEAAEGCIELDAESSTNNFTSHDNYTAQYPNDYSRCWIITASSGKKVQAISDDNIELEDCDDSLDVYCGDSSSDELYETYCDEAIVDVVSFGNELRFEFTTDSSDATSGFRIEYKEVSASTSSTCPESSESSVTAPGPAVGIIVAIAICTILI